MNSYLIYWRDMKLAFCLFNYFPYGGLQRDFLRIAKTCIAEGHEVHVYTMKWTGELEAGLHLHLITAKGWQNHTRILSYLAQVELAIEAEHYDLIVGFNKMPFLDVYYAADICYQAKIVEGKRFFYRLFPRYKNYVAMEEAVFARGHKTEIMMISSDQQPKFMQYYHTEPERFHLLPPGIAKDRSAPSNSAQIRQALRDTYQLKSTSKLILMIGSGFKTKGLDRAIKALSCLPSQLKQATSLFVIGQDNAAPFKKLAKKLQVYQHLHFLGGRDDIPEFMQAADLLIHPAYHENTGTVLLEALTAGLPVLTVDTCGYAHYVTEAKAGCVLASPFSQTELTTALQEMLLSSQRSEWRENALHFSKHADIYSLPEKAAELINRVGKHRASV